MAGGIRKNIVTLIIALVGGMVGANVPAIAHGVHAAFSHNSDKVDGIHAAKATAANKKKRLVATDATGKFPVSTIPKADAETLDGQDSTAFAGTTHGHAGADINSGAVDENFIDPDIARDSEIPAANTYTAGSGLDLSDNEFSIDPTETQARIAGSCAAGEFMHSIGQDGVPACGVDADTGVNAVNPSGGITGSIAGRALTLGVNSAVLQSRVTGVCAAGSSIRTIDAAGNVACETDDGAPLVGASSENGLATTAARSDHHHDDRYINENPGSPESASISIDGTLGTTGLLRTGSGTGTTDPPNPHGLVVRRITSSTTTDGSVVARMTGGFVNMELQRDGSPGGLKMVKLASSFGELACLGITSADAVVANYVTASGPVFTNEQNVAMVHCSFGDAFAGEPSTELTIRRNSGSSIWVGSMTSGTNQ